MAYTNSSLASYRKLSPNHSGIRKHVIDTISIHCYVGQVTVENGSAAFAKTSRKASCNYLVDKNGKIALIVEEKNRSWCTSSASNDHRAVTIEVASDTAHPYAVTDKAYNALIKLCADICKRNGIKKLVWSTNKSDRVNHRNGCNMTVHRDFANKACPGQYLYDRHGQIAKEVNSLLAPAPKPEVYHDYYKDPINWAIKNSITAEKDLKSFNPNKNCTRAQAITFLWRAAGKPEPAGVHNPFHDIEASDYFYKAVLWAMENGITSGVDIAEFGPDEVCTRAQIVTFLWRLAGQPEPTVKTTSFEDVAADAYYYKAVLWANENNITAGVSKTEFAPDKPCTRGQVVTFLYRIK